MSVLKSIKKTSSNETIKTAFQILIFSNSIVANFFVTKLVTADIISALYSKYIEKRADIQAAQILNNHKDMIKLYEYALAENGEIEGFFEDHPSFENRLAYLANDAII